MCPTSRSEIDDRATVASQPATESSVWQPELTRRRRSDDVAHRGGLAFGRVEMASPSGEPREFGPYGLQFGDALFDVDRRRSMS